jgi:Uma2 family endonuclease
MYAPVIQASMTFEEFLAWDDGTGRDFELRDGLPKRQKQVMTGRTPLSGRDESRRANIVVFAKDEWERLRQQSGSAAAYIPPPLAIEVVSTNWRDDYEYKLNEYEALGITEYWVVDYAALGGIRYIGKPKQPTITVYQLTEGEYQAKQFCGDDRLESLVLPSLKLTANQIFATGQQQFQIQESSWRKLVMAYPTLG